MRTYWLSGHAENGILHLINSGPATHYGTGRQRRDGQPVMKPFWEISDAEAIASLGATTWHPSITEYFPGGGWSTRFLTSGGMPVTMCINFVGHVHSVAVNQIRCSPHARTFAGRRLFPDDIVCCGAASVFLPYPDPGLKLS